MTTRTVTAACWSRLAADLLAELRGSPDGLSPAEAQERLQQVGPNVLKPRRPDTAPRSFITQFTSPLVLILVFAAVVSAIAGEWTDAAIVVASAVLSFAQESMASHAVEKLRAQVSIKATVLRDGKPQPIPAEEVVPGDIALLSAGSLIPADGVVLEAKDYCVNQAVLTRETFPVEKKAGPVAAHARMSGRINRVFMGTSVRSGAARAVEAHDARSDANDADLLNLAAIYTFLNGGVVYEVEAKSMPVDAPAAALLRF